MENLYIEKTKYTLKINFNAEKGILSMSGSSYPENAMEFFQPIIKKIETYISEIAKGLTLKLKIDYLNTSSTKCILDIFEIMEEYSQNNNNVIINWYYEKDDEDILETGEEMAEDLNLPINFISY